MWADTKEDLRFYALVLGSLLTTLVVSVASLLLDLADDFRRCQTANMKIEIQQNIQIQKQTRGGDM